MTTDAIFPTHSVTKTITSVSALMLVDRGKIALDDPVSKYIPSFAGMKVGVERKNETGKMVLDLVPPRCQVTIENLLMHTSGITYGFYGDGLVKAAYDGIYLGDFDNAEFAERYSAGLGALQSDTLPSGGLTKLEQNMVDSMDNDDAGAPFNEDVFGPDP